MAARFLGLTSVNQFLGGLIGGLACGGLLEHFGGGALGDQDYNFPGYAAIFLFAITCCSLMSSIAGLMFSTMGRSVQFQARDV